jgi:hypothetical protein
LKGEFMDEFVVKAELQEKRKHIKTFDELVEFLKDVETNYGNGYGEAPRTIAQAALAVAWHLADVYGITGFQAGFVMWDFIRDWSYSGNKCGLKMIDFDNMLYPQYEDNLQKTIRRDVWDNLQKEAKTRLKESSYAHPDVIAHWESIAAGNVPFGYRVVED